MPQSRVVPDVTETLFDGLRMIEPLRKWVEAKRDYEIYIQTEKPEGPTPGFKKRADEVATARAEFEAAYMVFCESTEVVLAPFPGSVAVQDD